MNARVFRLRWLGPIGLMIAVSLCSGGAVATFPPSPIIATDKLIHYLVFGLIATSILRALPKEMNAVKATLIAVILTSAFGASDEIHQGFTPGRSQDIYDWVADTLGAITACIVYLKWKQYRKVLEWRFFGRKPVTKVS